MQALDLVPSARAIALIIYHLSQPNGSNSSPGWTEESCLKIAGYAGLNRRQTFNLLSTLERCGVISSSSRVGNIVKRRVNFTEQGWVDFKFPDNQVEDLIPLSKEEIEFAAFDLVDEYKTSWSKKYGTHCHLTGRDRTKAFELIKSLGVDESLARLGMYLDDDDDWEPGPFQFRCASIAKRATRSERLCRWVDHGQYDWVTCDNPRYGATSWCIKHNRIVWAKKTVAYSG